MLPRSRNDGFLLLVCLLLLTGNRSTSAWAEAPLGYNRDVRPLLSDNCFFCHGPDATHREAGLRLDVEEDAKAVAIEPGDIDASELIARITSTDPDLVMPPPETNKQLRPEAIETLKRWVREGAVYEPYWAYAPPVRRAVPASETLAAKNAEWSAHPIDRQLMATWQARGMRPASDADPVTLLRRLHFDLTGLPPSLDDLRAYVQDPSPAAYEATVDRLLASEAFGERMAMFWLDLVRYADTVGYHGDQDHNISPYRDYVIDSFNQNRSFDQFTREQLAGDLLSDPTVEQLVATGYNRLLQTSHEGGLQPKEYLAIYAADRVRNLSSVWLGGTLGCAQCHDHKFDPYTSRDFYAMAAFFADVDEEQHFTQGSNALPTRRPPEMMVLPPAARAEKERLEKALAAARSATADEPQDAEPKDASGDDAAADKTLQQTLEQQLAEINQAGRLTMITKSIPPRTMRILPRGDWLDDSGPVVMPAVPTFLGEVRTDAERLTRLDLANWLVDDKQGIGGLTARVFANRFWYLMFGNGLSPSLDDFGGQGQPPNHPELLDQLALDFIASDWDVKHFLKELVMSRAYRQSSTASAETLRADPANLWFARQSRYRLPAEMVRDNALSVSGLLVHKVGGDSARPYQPAGYYRHLNFPQRTYREDKNENQWRRGVYTHWQRQFLHPMLKALDAPTREECTARRPRSNTPLEALVLLNDPTFVEAARALAVRILRDAEAAGLGTPAQRLRYGFRLVTSRDPDPEELAALTELLAREQQAFRDEPEAAQKFLEQNGQYQANAELAPPTLAAWTSVSRALLNLHETVTRN